MKVVTAGGLRTDYIITRNGQAHNGLPGGNALFAAAGAALWSGKKYEVAPWARYGSNFPHKWLQTLAELGLNTGGLINIPGEQDHRTFFAYTPDGQRVDTDPAFHFARIGQPMPKALQTYVHSTPQQANSKEYEPLAIRPSDWPSGFTNEVAAVHLAPLPLATHLHIPSELRDNDIKLITLDPGERYMVPERLSDIKTMLPQIDVFLPSDMEVRSLFGDEFSLWRAAELFNAWGAPLVVIKVGSRGILLYIGQTKRHYQLLPYHEPHDLRVIDVTGAGDAFCGGFIIGMLRTADPFQAANMGLAAASLVIEGYGALFALEVTGMAVEQRLQRLVLRQPISI